MAIYTGGMRMQDEARAAAKRIASQQAKGEEGEAKRKGRAGIFGKLAGMGIGHLAGLALAGVTGGLVNPLSIKLAQAAITGGSAWLGRAGAHQATTGKWDKLVPKGMSLKTSGQVGKIEAGGKYGYGREEAKTLSEALVGERTSKEDWGTLGAGIAGSLATDIAGDMGKKYSKHLTNILKGDKGKVLEKSRESVGFDVDEGFDMPWEDAPDEVVEDLWSPSGEWASPEAMIPKGAIPESPTFLESLKERIQQPNIKRDFFSGEKDVGHLLTPENYTPPSGYDSDIEAAEPFLFNRGGQVPQQQQLMALLALAQMQQQEETAYSDTALEEEKQQSTIADMFASQGKTLGGNNTQSLSQILGR